MITTLPHNVNKKGFGLLLLEGLNKKLETHSLGIADAVSRQHNPTLDLPYYQALHKTGSHRPDSQWGTIMGCLAIKHGPAWHGWQANYQLPFQVSTVCVLISLKCSQATLSKKAAVQGPQIFNKSIKVIQMKNHEKVHLKNGHSTTTK